MGIGDKLQSLIIQRKTNVNELSIQAKVSPSTLYSIIKRNNTKADIDVLIRIANILGVRVEYFSDENSLITNNIPQLTPQEEMHIKKYRQLDADGKDRINRQLDFELYQINQSAEKEELKLG